MLSKALSTSMMGDVVCLKSRSVAEDRVAFGLFNVVVSRCLPEVRSTSRAGGAAASAAGVQVFSRT